MWRRERERERGIEEVGRRMIEEERMSDRIMLNYVLALYTIFWELIPQHLEVELTLVQA